MFFGVLFILEPDSCDNRNFLARASLAAQKSFWAAKAGNKKLKGKIWLPWGRKNAELISALFLSRGYKKSAVILPRLECKVDGLHVSSGVRLDRDKHVGPSMVQSTIRRRAR